MQQANKGFTLVELIVTVAVLAIIAVMAVPSFATMYTRQKLESSAREIAMKVSEARSQAVLLRDRTAVCFIEQKCATELSIPTLKIEQEKQRIFLLILDSGVTVEPTSVDSLVVKNNGSITTQTNFIIARNGISYCIQVGVIGDTTIKEGACT